MDALVKSILSMLRVRSGEFAFIDLLGNSGVRIAPGNKIIFHLILRGKVSLKTQKPDAITTMNANDFVFCLHDTGHELIADLPGAPEIESNVSDMSKFFGSAHNTDIPPHVHFGRGSPSAQILTGALQLDPTVNRSILRVLPEILFVRGQIRGLSGKINYIYSTRQFFKASSTPGAQFFLRGLAELFLGEAIRLCSRDIKVPLDAVASTRSLTQVMIALQLMTNQPEKKWSVASLAKKVNMSRSGFAVAFKAAVGQPPLEYLTRIRMNKSSELLRSEGCSLKDIAYLVGYDSDVAFSRVFKHFYGLTPGEFRKQSQPAESFAPSTDLVELES